MATADRNSSGADKKSGKDRRRSKRSRGMPFWVVSGEGRAGFAGFVCDSKWWTIWIVLIWPLRLSPDGGGESTIGGPRRR